MRRLILIGALLAVTAAAGILLSAGISFYRSVDFDFSLLASKTAMGRGTVFTDRNGRELRFLPDLKGERARWAALDDIPETVRNAFIAAEDERFYEHQGFDAMAILRALWSNITRGRIVSGASTISQQVVRLVYQEGTMQATEAEPPDPILIKGGEGGFVTPENGAGPRKRNRGRTYRDKLVEIIRSVKMERVLSKDAILEQYLNRVPMGNNLVGIGAAARAYFGVSVKNLSVSEAALLAALPKAPSMLNPYGGGYGRLLERRNWVLGRMESLGLLSREKYLLARDEKAHLRGLSFGSAAPHVIDMLLKQVSTTGQVRTTIDLDLQTRVQHILASHAERLKYRGATQAAAIVIHNPTMEVLAAVGSLEYSEKNGGFNNGILAPRSAGSTLKPFLYAMAIESGETAASMVEDVERKYRSRDGQYAPLNYDRREYGPVKMRAALGNSLNLSAVRMLERVGEERFYDLLVRLNLINHPERGPEHYGLGMAIGNPEVSPEQLAVAYAMLANGGVYGKARYILNDRRQLPVGKPQPGAGSQGSGRKPSPSASRLAPQEKGFILLPQTAYIVTDVLSDPTARTLTFSRSRALMDLPFRAAVKTGTSTFFRDLWAVGYTPDYTAAVWVGNFDGSRTNNLTGASAAAPIFSDIMTCLYPQSEPVPFRRPKGIRRVEVCGYSGMKPTEHCPHTVSELFIAGTEPPMTCTFHREDSRRHELAAPFAGWLYDKSRTDSAGRFRLAGFGDDLSTVFQDPWEGVAAGQQEPAIRARNIALMKPAATQEEKDPEQGTRHYSIGALSETPTVPTDASRDGEIRITYPLDRDRFVQDRHERGQVIKLQAIVARPVPYVEWFVNGKLYKRTPPPYQTYWPLEEGRYRITAVTPENVGDSVQVTVE